MWDRPILKSGPIKNENLIKFWRSREGIVGSWDKRKEKEA